MSKVTVLLADSRPLMQLALRTCLHWAMDIDIVGEANSDAEAVTKAMLAQPRVIVLQDALPIMGGRATACLIHDYSPECRAIIIGGNAGSADEQDRVLCLPGNVPPVVLIGAIRGSGTQRPSGTEQHGAEASRQLASVHESSAALSLREQEVLRLLCLGLTNQEIAQRLFLSPYTVRNHVYRVLRKLGARNRTAAALQLARGLLTDVSLSADFLDVLSRAE